MCRLGKMTAAVLLACMATGLLTPAVQAGDDPSPSNWTGSGSGTTHPDGSVHVDQFSGRSSFLGNFTGVGFHVLNVNDFTFVGQATWTTSDGSMLSVTYTGQVFLSGDPDYPFGFVAVLLANGGTGRLAHATGNAAMTGGFTGVPGDLFFNVAGTLQPQGK